MRQQNLLRILMVFFFLLLITTDGYSRRNRNRKRNRQAKNSSSNQNTEKTELFCTLLSEASTNVTERKTSLENYTPENFKEMVEKFRINDISYFSFLNVLKIIDDAKNKLKDMPNIRTCHVKTAEDHSIIVGDLHGNFRDLVLLIDKFGIPGDRYQFVFNGDFVDRGDQQTEVFITLLYAFILHPERVFLNRGNHENWITNTRYGFIHDLKMSIEIIKSKHNIKEYYDAIARFYPYLPVATIVENSANLRLFIVHGGISCTTNLTSINTTDRFDMINVENREYSQFNRLLWNDPTNDILNNSCIRNENRGIGEYFDTNATKMFLMENKFTHLIRSHELKMNGFDLQHDNSCITLFSASEYKNCHRPYGYCRNFGAIIYFTHLTSGIENNSSDLLRIKNKVTSPGFYQYLTNISFANIIAKQMKVRENITKELEIFKNKKGFENVTLEDLKPVLLKLRIDISKISEYLNYTKVLMDETCKYSHTNSNNDNILSIIYEYYKTSPKKTEKGAHHFSEYTNETFLEYFCSAPIDCKQVY